MSQSAMHEQLAAELEHVADQGAAALRERNSRRGLHKGVRFADYVLLFLPALYLVVQCLRWLTGGPPWSLAPGTVFSLLFGAALCALFARWFFTVSKAVDTRDALAVVDKELQLEGRLLTAHGFIVGVAKDPGQSTDFVQAAIEDAGTRVQAALAARVHLNAADERYEVHSWTPRLIGLGLLLLAMLIGPQSWGSKKSGSDEEVAQAAGVLAPAINEESKLPEPSPEEGASEAEREEAQRKSSAGGSRTSQESDAKLSEDMKESEGKTGAGRSAQAESTSSASESRGQPSDQGPASSKPKEAKPGQKKPKKRDEAKEGERKRKEQEEPSGSTAGRGSSKGSSRNPAVSSWSSKDQVTSEDDQEIEDDEDAEDEEEDQESRGGVQPSLRDRKPPTSRDLKIGFGNQKNPDANGRGGPSQPKKSRGTASLVLGVPIPDRVKGQPGPGKTKVTQERIRPQGEDAAAVAAAARNPRALPVGGVERPDIEPWMLSIVKTYFMNLRRID